MFMRPVVQTEFRPYTVKREGFTPFMYCDQLNLVTTGIGNLVDNGPRNGFDTSDAAMAPAMRLPWKFKGPGWTKTNPVAGPRCSTADIRAAWIATKLKEQESPGFNKQGGFAYTGLTHITLDNEGLDVLFNSTLASFDASLAKRYLGYASWPADAQLCLLSMAWAMGPAFDFPDFKRAVDAEDFEASIPHAFFKGGGTARDKDGSPLVATRNGAHIIMLQNAANVVKARADRNRLFFPGTSPASPGSIASRAGSAALVGLEALAVTAGLTAVGYSLYEMKQKSNRRRRRAT